MIVEIDGQTYDVPDDATEAEIAELLGMFAAPPEPVDAQSLNPAAVGVRAVGAVPGVVRGAARFAANHVPATQKTIGALFTGAAGATGAAIGGVPGAVVGASIRGVTPTQAAIRETAGRIAGEAPAVARNAGRAVGVANYATQAGLPMKAAQLASTGEAAPAVDSFAKSMGQRIPRVLDQFGKVVFGPEAAPAASRPGIISRMAGSRAGGMLGQAAKLVTGPGTSALLASTEVNRRLNSPEAIEALTELQLPLNERKNRNPEQEQILARIAALLGI